MKPLIVTNAAGEPRRLNPMAVVGWTPAEINLGNGRIALGSVIAIAGAPPVQVLESTGTIDVLFEQATDGWMRPAMTRADLERVLRAWQDAEPQDLDP